jgi:chromosome segregation ATPase
VIELAEKSRTFDAAAARAAAAEAGLATARTLADSQAQALAELTEARESSYRRLSELEQRCALLALDKSHLQRELASAEARGDAVARESEERREQVC